MWSQARLQLERRAPAAVHELLQLGATVPDHGTAVREQEVLEVELFQQAGERVEQMPLCAGRIVHERVWDEAEPIDLSVRPPADSAVGEHERPPRREMQGGLIGAESADLVGDEAARECVAGIERGYTLAVGELVKPCSVAVHRAAERLLKARAVAVVVAV